MVNYYRMIAAAPSRPRGKLRPSIVFNLALILLLASPPQLGAIDRRVLPGHVPAIVSQSQMSPLDRVPATNRLELALGLPLRDRGTLTNLLHALYDPASPQFRQYLSAEQFARQFGPTEQDYAAVVAFAQAHHLDVVGTHPNRAILDVSGRVSDIERAFAVTIRSYQHPSEPRQFYAPDVDPSIPTNAIVPILYISGLENYTLPRPYLSSARLRHVTGETLGVGSAPGGGYGASDFRHAYVPNVSLTGSRQAIGLFELDGYYRRDILAYENLEGLPNVPLSNVLLNGFSGEPGFNNVEVAVDIQMALAMAPGVSQIIVYEGLKPNDVLNRMATDNLAKQLSSSWFWTPVDPIAEQIFEQMAAQGQSMFQASGDGDAYVGTLLAPSSNDSPFITVVGGTTLTMSGKGTGYLYEQVWNIGESIGGGGGVSAHYSIPDWQQGIDMTANGGSSKMRNLPDVALVADNIFLFANDGQMLVGGGTSVSAPLWAGFTALINEAASANDQPLVGFLNPALYAIGKSAAYADNFHDITIGSNTNDISPVLFKAVPGFDLCTGWGSPNGSNLVNALVFPEPVRILEGADLSFTGPIGGPFAPSVRSVLLTNAASGSVDYSISEDASWLTLAPADGGVLPSSSAVYLSLVPNSAASNLAPGLYTAKLLLTNLDDGSIQSRTVTLAIVTPPVITGQPSNQAVVAGMAAGFTVLTGTNAQRHYQWQRIDGTNAVRLTDSDNVSGSTTQTLTIQHASTSDAGSYSVIVSNAAGSVVSSNASLTLLPDTSKVVIETLYSFTTSNGFGVSPYSGLLLASDGNLYGTASGGGAHGFGAVFRMNAQGVVSLAHAFLNGVDGSLPFAGLMQSSNGLIYGAASSGGAGGIGTLFKMSTTGVIRGELPLIWTDLTNSSIAPRSALVEGADGNLYGTSYEGGLSGYSQILGPIPFNGYGTVFQVDPLGVVTTLASFNYDNGANPLSPLLRAADGSLYGTAQSGGTNGGWGTLFKITPTGQIEHLFSFANTNGAQPVAELAQDAAGWFYGTTSRGGRHQAGTVFAMSPGGVVRSLYSFSGTVDGSHPVSGLLTASDGNFYGTTESGGSFGLGTIFMLSPDGNLITLAHFDGIHGASPAGTLVQGTDGMLYGTTVEGGASGKGTIFRITIDGALEITSQPKAQVIPAGGTARFTVATYGSLPVSYRWQRNGSDLHDGGHVSGAASRTLTVSNVGPADAAVYSVMVRNVGGEVVSAGAPLAVITSPPNLVSQPQDLTLVTDTTAVFRVDAEGDLPLSFQWQHNGVNLVDVANVLGANTSTLTVASVDGASAGTYSVIVSNALAAVVSRSANLNVVPTTQPGVASSILHACSFDFFAGAYNPYAGVIQANDGFLYGTTINGGPGQDGTIFKLSTNGTFTILHSFSTYDPVGNSPYELTQGSDGNLYGVTLQAKTIIGGNGNGAGTLFRITPSGAVSLLYAFTGGADGALPAGALVPGSDGAFYGTTMYGGASPNLAVGFGGFGTVFKLATNGTLTTLAAFAGGTQAANPVGSLLWENGDLYGTSSSGGSNGLGTLFRVTTNGTITTLASFDYSSGAYPSNRLVKASDGAFYGTASHGGTNGGWGTVFRATADGTLTAIHSFGYDDGAVPVGGLVQGTDGKLYGTTSQGGFGGLGTVFQITTNGQLSTLLWFNGLNGANPQSSLIQARNGSFYGTTEFGGADYNSTADTGEGVVFRLTLPMSVSPSPQISLRIVNASPNVSISWSGGQPPYYLESSRDLSDAGWQRIAGPITHTSVTFAPSGSTGFYRVQGKPD
jgi:uncharacterized repeat protein (TIGR03803 family)